MAMPRVRDLSASAWFRPETPSVDALAVVGVGCRLPGGVDCLDELWAAMVEGRSAVGAVSLDTAGFDAEFFGLPPEEAALLDPRQRLVFECAVEAFDDAGIAPATLAGTDTAAVIGGLADTADRLSAAFGLRAAVHAESALGAVRQAAELLRSGRGGPVLAGGVNLGEDGDGVAVFVLKPLDRALADGDRVHAVTRTARPVEVEHLDGRGVAALLRAILVLREGRVPVAPDLDTLDHDLDLGLAPVAAFRPLAGGGMVDVPGLGVLGAPTTRPVPTRPGGGGRLPVVFSAGTQDALDDAVLRWTYFLEKTDPSQFYDVAYTSCLRRGHHEQRLALLADGPQEAAATARLLAAGEQAAGGVTAAAVHRGRVCFVFDGNGSQWPGMGCDMLTTDDVFRAEVTALDEILTPMLGWSVLGELTDPDLSQWDRVDISQPLLFAVQAGMVAALAARGVVPEAVTGHSVGEVAAAYCAGVLDRHTACWVVAERTFAQAATAGSGRMAVLGLGVTDTERLLAEVGTDVVVAAINSPQDVTLCGPATSIAALGEEAARRGLFYRDVGLDYAYHGPAMEPVRDMLVTGLAGMTRGTARIPMISALTGERVAGPELDGDYWYRNLRHEVRFTDAVDKVVGEHGCDVLVEIGPRPVLGAYMRRLTEKLPEPVEVVPTMTRKTTSGAALDAARLQLIAAGARIDWELFFPERGVVSDLPSYPWQRHFVGDGALCSA
ncbi:acyltransferase domain-containing protein [Actinophytocola oryzae]|uniref:Beta-ketoacyl synthase-like protein n=1 Tax=Actinophytocola oryzae TaxID=502181 RepID=A0A4R7VI55_9PSEU|nr:acyltransferase domain-containing protein [Actinophytocola oryzae]TDV48857.1 beta-ketoacyl synthase-like protein [Actinophytocola oryzae]